MPRIERPGSSTVYEVVGSGPPVVLGHSLLCNRGMWAQMIAELADRFTFINVGLRGHGESSATAPFTVWDLADDWLAILDAEGIERAALCGLSTGGMTAMRLAVRHPERVCAMAIVDSDAGPESSAWKRFQYSVLGRVYRATGFIPVGTVAKAMFGPDTLANHRDRIDELVELMRGVPRAELSRAMRAVFGRDSVDVSKLEIPTLVVVGEHDAATPPAASKRIAEAIAGARLEVIEGAGHLTAIEEPAALAALVGDHLSALTPW